MSEAILVDVSIHVVNNSNSFVDRVMNAFSLHIGRPSYLLDQSLPYMYNTIKERSDSKLRRACAAFF